MVSTIYVAAYIAGERPYTSRFMNVQELLNELTVFVAAYPLLAFTNWVSDYNLSLNNGWFIVACIGVNVLFNITIVVVIFLRQICRKIRFNFIRKRNIQEALKRNEER